MNGTGLLCVEVAYAGPEGQWIIPLQVEDGTTLEQAVRRSGLLDRVPVLAAAEYEVGIFSKPAPRHAVLRAGDRVEVYRPLLADPKVGRRSRARLQVKPRR